MIAVFFILVIIILPTVFGVIIYSIIKEIGKPKIAKYFAIIYFLLLSITSVYFIFEDKFFSKTEAKELIQEQNILLSDDFKILNNETTSAIGDYYHTFTLQITEKDRLNGIKTIKTDINFVKDNTGIIDYLYDKNINRYIGDKQTQNYETSEYFVREYFQPNGNNYAPTFRRIKIDKNKNELIFQDIVE